MTLLVAIAVFIGLLIRQSLYQDLSWVFVTGPLWLWAIAATLVIVEVGFWKAVFNARRS